MVDKQDEISGGKENVETTQPSKPEPKTTPKEEETVTLSSKELNDRINAAKAELGRTLKSTLDAHSVLQRNYDGTRQQLSTLEETIKSLKQKERERELQSADGKPDVLDSVRLKHQAEDEWEKVNKARSDYEKERSQYQTELDEAAKLKAERKAEELSKECGLATDLLLQIGTDTAENGRVSYNLKRMEAISKSVPKNEEGEEVSGEEGAEKVKGQKSRASVTGRNAGRGLQTITDYYEAYNRGEINAEQMAEARRRFGVAY